MKTIKFKLTQEEILFFMKSSKSIQSIYIFGKLAKDGIPVKDVKNISFYPVGSTFEIKYTEHKLASLKQRKPRLVIEDDKLYQLKGFAYEFTGKQVSSLAKYVQQPLDVMQMYLVDCFSSLPRQPDKTRAIIWWLYDWVVINRPKYKNDEDYADAFLDLVRELAY